MCPLGLPIGEENPLVGIIDSLNIPIPACLQGQAFSFIPFLSYRHTSLSIGHLFLFGFLFFQASKDHLTSEFVHYPWSLPEH